jgi:peroxiredoxin Q/BCP
MLEAGQEAPSFDVPDHTGKRVKLSDFRGRNVLLWFYPKADTPG